MYSFIGLLHAWYKRSVHGLLLYTKKCQTAVNKSAEIGDNSMKTAELKVLEHEITGRPLFCFSPVSCTYKNMQYNK